LTTCARQLRTSCTRSNSSSETDDIVARSNAEAEKVLARSRGEAAERLQRLEEEIVAAREQAEARIQELHAETEAVSKERHELLDEIHVMGTRLLEVASGAAARVSPTERAEVATPEAVAGGEAEPARAQRRIRGDKSRGRARPLSPARRTGRSSRRE
jgi:hypothetical protein